MRKLLLSLCLIAIFAIGDAIINLKMIESPNTEKQNISEINNIKIHHSEKEKIFHKKQSSKVLVVLKFKK